VFKALTLKTKIIIFIFLSLIGVYIIVDTALDNRRTEAKLKGEYEAQLKEKEQEKQRLEVERKKAEEDAKKRQEEQRVAEEKRKLLEDKYNNASSAFFERKYSEAIKISDEILKEDSGNYTAYNIKGIALCYSGKFDEGMQNIDKSLEIKTDYGYARFNKALAYELFGHYERSLQWYDKALEVEDYVWSYYGKASIYGRKGDVANTIRYLKIAIDKNPGVKEAAAEEADFNNVRNSREFQQLIK
jgi:tetratricopeptide (TPR) repeat protein